MTTCYPLRLLRLTLVLTGVALLLPLTAPDFARSGELVCPAGRADDYATTDGNEPTSPSAALLTSMARFPASPPRAFDECLRNYTFAHTVTGCALDSGLTSAFLTLRLRGTPQGETYSDRLVLGDGGTLRWGIRMSTLQSLRAGGADGTWSTTDSATFVLDLGNLPPSEAAPSGWPTWPVGQTNLLPFLRAGGDLDIILPDDTCVDVLMVQVDSTTPALPATWGRLKGRYR